MNEYLIVQSDEWLSLVKELFLEYATSLNFNLCFQSFDQELAGLPGDYAPPKGRLMLAISDGKPAGCVALRKLAGDICEMKRLYVKPSFRGKRIGKELSTRIIEEAKKAGYSKMRLDTVPEMRDAITIYRSLGFYPIDPYRENPIAGALFMELDLKPMVNTRAAHPEDLKAIFELICDLENTRFDEQEFEKLYLANLANREILYLVAEDGNGTVTGFISCHGQLLLHHLAKVFEIQELVVDKDHRNKKVGEHLVRAVEEILKTNGHRFIEVTTNIKREAAHRFYEKCGYHKTHFKFTKILGEFKPHGA